MALETLNKNSDGGSSSGATENSPAHSGYAPDDSHPVAPYATLTGIYCAGTAAALIELRSRQRELPERFSAADAVMLGIGTQKASRLIARDRVTSFLRAPFTRLQGPAGHGEVDEQPTGHGLHLAVGELLVCPRLPGGRGSGLSSM